MTRAQRAGDTVAYRTSTVSYELPYLLIVLEHFGAAGARREVVPIRRRRRDVRRSLNIIK